MSGSPAGATSTVAGARRPSTRNTPVATGILRTVPSASSTGNPPAALRPILSATRAGRTEKIAPVSTRAFTRTLRPPVSGPTVTHIRIRPIPGPFQRARVEEELDLEAG